MNSEARRNEVEQLESQLRIMSQAAAEAIERASKLETELANSRSSMSSSSSQESLADFPDNLVRSPNERLQVLENALSVIHRSRSELSGPYNFEYL